MEKFIIDVKHILRNSYTIYVWKFGLWKCVNNIKIIYATRNFLRADIFKSFRYTLRVNDKQISSSYQIFIANSIFKQFIRHKNKLINFHYYQLGLTMKSLKRIIDTRYVRADDNRQGENNKKNMMIIRGKTVLLNY